MCFGFQLEKKLPQPKSTEEVTAQELLLILRRKFPEGGRIYLSDHKYKLCNIEDVQVFCEQDQTNSQKYITEDYDCDDFSYRLMGQMSIPKWSVLAFGICWTNLHALNCFVGEDEQVYFLEPQSDTIRAELEDWQGSQLQFIAM